MGKEIWKSVGIPQYSRRYEVSNLGRLRSRYYTSTVLRDRPKILTPFIDNGYEKISLGTGKGKRKTFLVHRLVAITFLGPPPDERPHVNHLDGNKANNRLSNLEYCSAKENNRHAAENGLSGRRGCADERRLRSLRDAWRLAPKSVRETFLKEVAAADKVSHIYGLSVMPKAPKLSRNGDGRAYARIPMSGGRRIYFGMHGTDEALQKYSEWIHETGFLVA